MGWLFGNRKQKKRTHSKKPKGFFDTTDIFERDFVMQTLEWRRKKR